MPELLKPDICVIGAGSGGLSVAAGAAAFGVDVVLIEKGAMGGDCLNSGCVPSKSLIAAANRAQAMREASAFGIASVEPQVNFRRVRDHVQGVIAGIAPTDSAERFRALGVTVIGGEARFEDRRTIVVGDCRIRARRFVLATGSTPAVPPIEDLKKVPYHTNESIFSISRKPGHLIVIGGGPIGLELAQAMRRLGPAVTVLEADRFLSREDPELAAVVLDMAARDGVDLRPGVRVERIEPRGTGVRVTLDGAQDGTEVIDGTDILVATGRRPVVRGLELEKAGIAYEDAGVTVDRRLRTTNRRVYAVGDVAGGPQFTHVASYHAGIVVRNLLFRMGAKLSYDHVPRVTFTSPELAQVGLTEEEARARSRQVQVLRWPYAENDRARTGRDTAGLIKIIATPKGRILGAGIVGVQAGELIQSWSLAIQQGLDLRAMASVVAPYPTLSEIGKRAAFEFYRPRLTRPPVRSIISVLRLFG